MGLFCKIGNQSSIWLKTVNCLSGSIKGSTFALSIGKKDKTTLFNNLKPWWCIGELLQQYDEN